MELFKIGFISVGLIDLFDVGIVSILFFFLYRALKNTIALQILIGMIVLIALASITETMSLQTTNWLLNKVTEVWLLAFVILFQPEIRKMLLIVTRNPLLNRIVRQNIFNKLDDVVDAVTTMSDSHIGALIVFTQSQNVQMTVDTGVSLQSTISKELLLALFNPRSPLHDGAVIIDNNVIVAAKCILPLSQQKRYGTKILGTRHRAALGLSEQIDSIVLIVSEETRAISIAQSGELMFNIPKENLKEVLKEKLLMKTSDT